MHFTLQEVHNGVAIMRKIKNLITWKKINTVKKMVESHVTQAQLTQERSMVNKFYCNLCSKWKRYIDLSLLIFQSIKFLHVLLLARSSLFSIVNSLFYLKKPGESPWLTAKLSDWIDIKIIIKKCQKWFERNTDVSGI